MEDSFGINNVALVDGQPRTLGLKQLLEVYLAAPVRRGAPPLGVPPRQGRRPAAPRRGAAAGDPRHRRGHPADPLQRQRREAKERLMTRLRPHRPPGDVHPRHAAAPADEVLPARAGEREDRAGAARSRSSTRSSTTRSSCARWSPTSSPRSPRRTARRAAPSCSSPPASRRRTAVPLEVADDPCFVYLSSAELLARTTDVEPPGDRRRTGPTTTWSCPPCAATARGQVGRAHQRRAAGAARRPGPADPAAAPPTRRTSRAARRSARSCCARGRPSGWSGSVLADRRGPGAGARHPTAAS